MTNLKETCRAVGWWLELAQDLVEDQDLTLGVYSSGCDIAVFVRDFRWTQKRLTFNCNLKQIIWKHKLNLITTVLF